MEVKPDPRNSIKTETSLRSSLIYVSENEWTWENFNPSQNIMGEKFDIPETDLSW
jgi:hypothetical protein